MINRGTQSSYHGFSLVEVTLALGIIAFGLIAIFGLLPSGLGLVRESAAEATAVNVMGVLAIELRAGSISPPDNEPLEMHYDSDGLLLDSSVHTPASYLARIEVLKTAKPKLANLQILWPQENPVNLVETIVVLPSEP